MASSLFALHESDSDSDESSHLSYLLEDSSEASDDEMFVHDGIACGIGECFTSFLLSVSCILTVTWLCLFTVLTDHDVLAALAHSQQQRLMLAAFRLFQSRPGSYGPNCQQTEFCWEAHVRRLSEPDFKLRYRLSIDSFNTLLDILAPLLSVHDEKQALNSRSGEPICLQARLAVALRYFAGGDPKDLFLIYHMSKCMVMKCVWRAVDTDSTGIIPVSV